MKQISFKFILFFFFILFITSCLGTTDPAEISTNPTFVSLTFAKNDSIPNIEKAVFSLEYDATIGDSIIQNVDSLPYKTRIDSVFPTFSFRSSSAAFFILDNDSSVAVTGKDTVDFSKVKKIRNVAQDKKAERTYHIKVNVHQVETELYVWSKISEKIHSVGSANQKAIILNDKILYFLNNENTNYLYTSVDGYNWSSVAVTNLPANPVLREMVSLNGKLYLLQGGTKIYFSTDGASWSNADCTTTDYDYSPLLFALNGKLYAVAQSKSNQKRYFASSTDGISWSVDTNDEVSERFPVRDFAALSFLGRTGKPKAIVLGGYNADNTLLKNCWSTENGTYWVNFTNEVLTSLDSLATGASVVAYDDKLLLFGGMTKSNLLMGDYYRESIDEGYSWRVPDTTYNKLPANFANRTHQSVVVLKPYKGNQDFYANRIFILGGQTKLSAVSDVWTGKLNRKAFETE